MKPTPRLPQAFRITPVKPVFKSAATRHAEPRIEFDPLPAAPAGAAPAPMAEANARRRHTPWGYLLIISLLSLLALWFSLSLTKLIADFFLWSQTLGWISTALASLAGLALLAIAAKEFWGLMRLRQIEKLQIDAARAINQNDATAAATATRELKALYHGRADMAWALRSWSEHDGDIIDPPAAIKARLIADPTWYSTRLAQVKGVTEETTTATLPAIMTSVARLMASTRDSRQP